MPKRIVIDARESGTSTGRYVDKLIEYLHKLQPAYEVIVLTKAPRIEFMKTTAPDFMVVESNYKEFTFAEQVGFLRQLNGQKADLVHFGMIQQPILYRGKAVTAILDLTTARFRNPAKNWLVYWFKQQVYKWVIKRVARKSSRVITISNFIKKDVAQYAKISPNKICVIYPAADKITVPAEPLVSLADKDFIMHVGRAQPHKNLKNLVEAFAKLKRSQPKLQLVFVGKIDDNYRLLQKYVKNRGVDDVVFTDFVSEGQLRWLYENARAYVFPSLSEGFGLPGLEALAHGLPLISSRATCLPEIYKDAAIYFDPKNTSDIAEKIKMVLDSPKIAHKMHEAGPMVATQYSWEKTAQQTLALYEQALESR
ncbi:MAG: glycosyltransferase family 1 protein [bacterium]|nr:glycosyltransferase family 1 protein [bacterium]